MMRYTKIMQLINFFMQIFKNIFFLTFLLLCSCATSNLTTNHNMVIEKYDGSLKEYQNNQKVVLVGGCFDIVHYGHIEFLKKAKAAGDYLIVALEPDERIKQKKRTPVHNQQERAEILASISCVDKVVMLPVLKGFDDYNQLVQNINPNVIAVTKDDPQLRNKQKQANNVGAEIIVVTPRLEQFATSFIVKSNYLKE